MNNQTTFFVIDDDFEVEPFMKEFRKSLENRCNSLTPQLQLICFKDFESAVEFADQNKPEIKYCVLDPVLSNKESLDKPFVIEKTISRIKDLLLINPEMGIAVLSNMDLLHFFQLENQIDIEIKGKVECFGKGSYISSGKFFIDNLLKHIFKFFND